MTSQQERIDVAVLGGSGYVSGEVLRLLAGHPCFQVTTVVSTSQVGEPVESAFAHLAGTTVAALRFAAMEQLVQSIAAGTRAGIIAATPHGTTAPLIGALLDRAAATGADLRVVDLSADFRFPTAEEFQAIYKHDHGAPAHLSAFVCAVPEHHKGATPKHAAQPGCFTTAATTAAYPFLALGLVEPDVFVSAITGSSGSGRKLGVGTHHPDRRSNLYAYSALGHRHEAEMRRLLSAATGGEPVVVDFVPHSGPFVRGIHATVRMRLRQPLTAAELAERAAAFYRESPFIEVGLELPHLTAVVGTNRCRLGVAARGRTLVVTSVIDNLVKGAAGGGIQWLNRLFGLPEETGLRLPGLGWF